MKRAFGFSLICIFLLILLDSLIIPYLLRGATGDPEILMQHSNEYWKIAELIGRFCRDSIVRILAVIGIGSFGFLMLLSFLRTIVRLIQDFIATAKDRK